MKKSALAKFVCLTAVSTACQDVRTEFSEIRREEAIVENVVYTPSTHETVVEPSFGGSGAVGFGASGGVGIRIGNGIQITNVTVPEKFAVVFQCPHGQFIISRREVYEGLKNHVGKRVDVSYREIYRTTYEDRDGKKQAVKRELVDYDFLNAVLRPER